MTPVTTLHPAQDGWRIDPPGTANAPLSPEAVAAELAGRVGVELVLPTRLALFEWFTLPSADPDELSGMTELQLEKRLPYPLEEMRYAHRIVSTSEEEGGEGRVFAAACHQPRLDALAEPLVIAGCTPGRVSFEALRVGSVVEGIAAAVWQEEEELVFAVFDQGYPLLVEIFDAPEQINANAARLRMATVVAGVAEMPQQLWIPAALQSEAQEWLGPLGIRELELLPARLGSDFPDLAPPEWREARLRTERRLRLLHGAKVAGVAFIGIIAAGFGLLAWKKQQLRSMEAELSALRPGMESLLVTQARWNALAPATDSSRYTVELLHRISAELPSDQVRITSFSHTLSGFAVQGEAPSAREAVDFAEKLKTSEATARYTLETPPPTLLTGDRAQFVIRGK